MSYLWRVPHALDGHRLEAAAGPLPATPLAIGLRRSLADLGFAAPDRVEPGRGIVGAVPR
jgi:hypothetical protein